MKVLLVEDSKRMSDSIAKALRHESHVVDCVYDGDEGLWHCQDPSYDLLILDVMLPKLDGFSMLSALRKQENPIRTIMLTARDGLEDRIRGLRGGADDYLVKPFELAELTARVSALGRRQSLPKIESFSCSGLTIDVRQQQAKVAGETIPLSAKEYRIIEYLAKNRDRVVSRSEIEEKIYGSHAEPMSNVIDVAISQIRKKLGKKGLENLIGTRRGLGYVMSSQ